MAELDGLSDISIMECVDADWTIHFLTYGILSTHLVKPAIVMICERLNIEGFSFNATPLISTNDVSQLITKNQKL